MIQSPDQSSYVEAQLLSMIDRSLDPHFNRGLSFRGRATIINSLILSKLWYSLWLLNPSADFFTKLDSKLGTFLSCSKKIGRFSIQHMKRPVGEGGLGIIDPKVQHQALQIRWSTPLLLQQDNTTAPTNPHSSSIAISWVRYNLQFFLKLNGWHLDVPCIWVSPTLRQQILNNTATFSPIRANIKYVSTLPDLRIDMNFTLTPATTLEFPLNDIWFAANKDDCIINTKSYKTVKVSDIFTYDDRLQCLVFRMPGDPARRYPQLTTRFQQAICTHQIYLLPFVATHTLPPNILRPFGAVESTGITNTFRRVYKLHETRSRSYRLTIPHNTPLSHSTVDRMSQKLWKKFWRNTLNFRAKKIWYQLLHNKINTKVVTNRYMLDIATSLFCPLCPGNILHYPEHMFVECQNVWPIWNKSFSYLFPRQPELHTLTARRVLSSLYSYQFPSTFQFRISAAFFLGPS